MTNKEALDILKDRKIAYEVVITRTASHENRHMAEEELKLINACIIALEHKEFIDSAELEKVMKAILVIDIPNSCSTCKIVHPDIDGYYCPFEPILIANRSAMSKRMDWCPLSHPLKRVGHDYYIYDRKYLLDNLDREIEMLKKVKEYESNISN